MIRILHIVGSAAPNGTTKQIASLATALPKSEFEFKLISLGAGATDSPVLQQAGLSPIVIRLQHAFDPLALLKLRRQIQQLHPAIVHTWQFETSLTARWAALWAGAKKLIAQQQHIDPLQSDATSWLDRRLANHTHRFITDSATVREFCRARGIPSQKLCLIPKPVLPAQPPRLSRSEILAQLGLPTDAKLILYLGALVKEKRLKELIWAADQLKAVEVPAHLLLVGDGPMRGRLERYRAQNRIEDRVHFLGQRSDVAELVAHADVVWQAAAHEGQSSAILEAMAAGKPVVAADAAGNRELVTNGETGYLVPLSERAGFARWTLPLLEDPQLAHRLGVAGQQQALHNHNPNVIAQKYADLYRSALAH